MTSAAEKKQLEQWFIFQNDRLLLLKDTHHFPKDAALSNLKSSFVRQLHLGEFNNIDCYCAEIDEALILPTEIEAISLRKAFEIVGTGWFLAAAKAYSVINWDKNHRFCGRCGNETIPKSGTFERNCHLCGLSMYPRISPSIIVLIKKGDYVLMARNHRFPPGAYALIAGFVEAGESVEDAVKREVREEVGLEIKNLKYFGSQSWPFPDSLMIGFIADYASGDITIDTNEIEDAGWYRYDNLPGRPSSSISIAKKLIDHFIATKKTNQ